MKAPLRRNVRCDVVTLNASIPLCAASVNMVPGGCCASVVGAAGGGIGVEGDDMVEPPLEHALRSRTEKALNFLENMWAYKPRTKVHSRSRAPAFRKATVDAAI